MIARIDKRREPDRTGWFMSLREETVHHYEDGWRSCDPQKLEGEPSYAAPPWRVAHPGSDACSECRERVEGR